MKGKIKFVCERFVFMCKHIVSVCMYFVCICECFLCLPVFFRIDVKILLLDCKCLLKISLLNLFQQDQVDHPAFIADCRPYLNTQTKSGGPLGKFELNRFLYKSLY